MRWLTLSLDAKSTMVEIAYGWLKVRWSKVQGVVESAGGSRFEVIWCYCAACAAQRPVCFVCQWLVQYGMVMSRNGGGGGLLCVPLVRTTWYDHVPGWWWWWLF